MAQRSGGTRAAVETARGAARFSVLDVNLRPPYDNAELVGAAVAGGVSLLKVCSLTLGDTPEILPCPPEPMANCGYASSGSTYCGRTYSPAQ